MTLDDLARALDRARALHEARPDDRERERRYLEAHNAFLVAHNARLADELAQANGRVARMRMEVVRLQREFRERARALLCQKPKPRRTASDDGAPLLEGMT